MAGRPAGMPGFRNGPRSPHWAWDVSPEEDQVHEESAADTISLGSEGGNSPEARCAEARALVEEPAGDDEPRSEAELLQREQRRCRRRRLACLLAVSLAAVAVTAAAVHVDGSVHGWLYGCEALVALLLFGYVALRWFGLLRPGSEVPLGALVAWLLSVLLCLAAPGRQRRVFYPRAVAAAARAWGPEPCEEGATALWLALVLSLVATLLPMRPAIFAAISQVICLQYLVLGLAFPRPECEGEGWASGGGPLLGLPPMWASALQLYLLTAVFTGVQYQLWADSRTEGSVARFLRHRDPLRRSSTVDSQRSIEESESRDNGFVLQLELETLLEEIEQEERRWRRFIREVRENLPWGAPARTWAGVVGILVQAVSDWREELKSQASQNGELWKTRGLVEKVAEISTREDLLLNLEAVSQFVCAPLQEGDVGGGKTGFAEGNAGGGKVHAAARRPMQLKTIPGLCADLRIGEWEFDAFEVDQERHHHVLQVVGFELLRPFTFLPRDALSCFLERLEAGYVASNPYHSHIHAADMSNSFLYIVSKCGLWRMCDTPDAQYAAMIIAAIGHDVGHFGRNNMFLVSGRHALAVTYNDRSVMENFHASTLVKLIDEVKDGGKLLQQLSSEQASKARQLIITLILATDTQKHLEELGAFRVRVGAEGFDPFLESGDQQQTFSMIFRAADIGHSAKPWSLHEEWSRRVAEEFHLQGDNEKQLGLKVSPLCERDGFKLASSQVGFLQFICLPTWRELSHFEDAAERARTRPHTSTSGDRFHRLTRRIINARAAGAVLTPGGAVAWEGRRAARVATIAISTPIVPAALGDRGDGPVRRLSLTAHAALGVEKDLLDKKPKTRWMTEVCLAQCEENFQGWKSLADAERGTSEPPSVLSRHPTQLSFRAVSRHTTQTATESSFNSLTGSSAEPCRPSKQLEVQQRPCA